MKIIDESAMQFEIGEKFLFVQNDGRKVVLEAVDGESGSCRGCHFENTPGCHFMSCTAGLREDGKKVIFVERGEDKKISEEQKKIRDAAQTLSYFLEFLAGDNECRPFESDLVKAVETAIDILAEKQYD